MCDTQYPASRTLHSCRWSRTMSISAPTLLTIGEIARRLSMPVHRVEYVIRARRILPSSWAGNARVFSEDAVTIVEAELRRISDAKCHDYHPAIGG